MLESHKANLFDLDWEIEVCSTCSLDNFIKPTTSVMTQCDRCRAN